MTVPKRKCKKLEDQDHTAKAREYEKMKEDDQVESEQNEDILNLKEIVNIGNSENKSRAVVEYSAIRTPDLKKLQNDTDLNLSHTTHTNWMSSSRDSYRLKRAFTLTPEGFIRMNQMHPDCVGYVDVVSVAENIKKLLNIPYTMDGNTLLINSFDLYNNLIRIREAFPSVNNFISGQLGTKAIQDGKRMFTKDSMCISVHNHNVVWTFEDIEMVLDSGMPIFGGDHYPCISLRLRDMEKPINILTGIDYWLDNLMSNVPEVVMRFHLNRIIHKYEFPKTEGFPILKNSKFSPQIIQDVAQNILYFVRTNATTAGHTHWLFRDKYKDKECEIIKLYDLTCLSPQKDEMQSPFIIPVAVLLYRVARKFIKSGKEKTGVIKTLLEHFVKIIPEDQYPGKATYSYFMLSDIYLPKTTDPEAPKFDIEDETEGEFPEIEENEKEAIKILGSGSCENKKKITFKPSPIKGDTDYRCLKALTYVYNGLKCLHYPDDEPGESVPMGYLDKKEIKKKKGKKNKKKNQKDQDGISWKTDFKILLYEKAILIFKTMSEYYFGKEQYENCFRNLRLLARCFINMRNLKDSSNLDKVCLLTRAVDCLMKIFEMSAKKDSDFQKLRQNIIAYTKVECDMLGQIISDEQQDDLGSSPNLMHVCDFLLQTREDVIQLAAFCCEEALKIPDTDIPKRLGIALNDIGTYYFGLAKDKKGRRGMRKWLKKAQDASIRSLEAFVKIKDIENASLVSTNLGQMYHLIELSYRSGRPLSTGDWQKQKEYLAKAKESLKMAVRILENRETSPHIWDEIRFALCGTLVAEASLMQDQPPENKDFDQNLQDVWNSLTRATIYYDKDETHTKYRDFRIKFGVIHYRFASLYHLRYSRSDDAVIQVANFHSAKNSNRLARESFFETSLAFSYYRTILQLVKMLDHGANNQTFFTGELKKKSRFESEAVHSLLNSIEMGRLVETGEAILNDEQIPSAGEEDSTLTKIAETCIGKVQFYLLSLLKMFNQEVLRRDELINMHKECYAEVLKFSLNRTEEENVWTKFCQTLLRVNLIRSRP